MPKHVKTGQLEQTKKGKITRGKIFWEVGLCIFSHSIRYLDVHYITILTSLAYLT